MKAGRAPKPPRTDRRLLGTWVSDGPRTLAEWRFRRRLSPERRRRFLSIFGRLELTYTRTRIHGVLDDYRYRSPYEILAVDADSVALRFLDPVVGQWTIQHLRFEDDGAYWVALGANREWFRRKPPGTARKPCRTAP